jgi:site-specific DNA-cytosine methylase
MGEQLCVVSLFSGIEGFGLAAAQLGIPLVASVEIDPDCRQIIAAAHPGAVILADIKEVTCEQLEAIIGAAGFDPSRCIICAGFPCQDLSVAGRRAGLGGARSGLFWEIVRLAHGLRPRWLILENVPGLLSAVCSCPGDDACTANGRALRCGYADRIGGQLVWVPNAPHSVKGGACAGGCMARHGGGMGAVLGSLAELGHGYAYRVLDAQFFGLAQRRERVFIAASAGNRAAPAQVLFEPEGSGGHHPQGAPEGTRVAGTLAASAGGGGLGGAGQSASAITSRVVETWPLQEIRGRAGPAAADPRAGIGIGAPGDPMFTLQAEHQHGIAAVPIQDGRDIDKDQNGLGVGEEDEPAGFTSTGRGWWRDGVGTLRSEGGDGAGGEHLIVGAVPIQDGRDIDKDQNGLGVGEEGDPAYTLDTTGAGAVATLQGGGRRGHRIDAEGAAGGHLIAHALTSEGADASEDGTGCGTPLVAAPLTAGSHSDGVSEPGRRQEDDVNLAVVAFADRQITSPHNRANPLPGGPAPTLGADSRPHVASVGDEVAHALTNHAGRNDVNVDPLIAFAVAGDFSAGEVAQAIRRAGEGNGGQPGGVAQGTSVRRLTPRECERLQGFPDDYTRWRADGREQSDSARYRQLGNAVAVPVARWILGRVVASERGEL